MSLQIPICAFDARTGILCTKCESRLKGGQIRDTDIHASRALLQLAGRFRSINTVILVRSFKVGGDYVLEVGTSGIAVLRSDKDVVPELEKALGGRVWLTDASDSNMEFVEDLLHPIKILSLSTVWLPDGSSVAKAVIQNVVSHVTTRRLDAVKKIMKEVRGMDLVVESEDGQVIGTPSPIHKRQIAVYEESSPAALVSARTHRADLSGPRPQM